MVLLVGEDDLLLRTRAAVLRTIGVEVAITNASAALEVQAARACDLLLLCHSVPEEVAAVIAAIFRARWQATPILRITSLRSWGSSQTDGLDAITSAEPDRLVKRTAELLHIGISRRAIA
jgi:DNA-binding response OmpR family regulator